MLNLALVLRINVCAKNPARTPSPEPLAAIITDITMDPIAIASLVVGIVGVIFTWLQVDHRFKKKKQVQVSKATDSILDVILQDKKITVGWFSYYPFVYLSKPNDKIPVGIYPLLVNQVATKFNLQVEWRQLNISETVEMVNNRKVDIVVSVFQTPNRARQVDFTAFLHSITVAGVAKRIITDIHSQSDLLKSEYSIAVAKNEIGHELVEAIKIRKSRITVIDSFDISKVISSVKAGETDIVLLDSVSIRNYLKTLPKTEIKKINQIFVRRPLAICHNGIMILQNQIEFANWLDTEFRIARENIEIAEYEKKILTEYEDIVSAS